MEHKLHKDSGGWGARAWERETWGSWGQEGMLSLPPDSFLLFSFGSREEEQEELLAGGQSRFLVPRGVDFPSAGLGEEVINDREARRGECSGLMLVLIRSWSPARDRIQLGHCARVYVCVCVCVCVCVGMWGAMEDQDLLTHPFSLLLPIVRPPPTSLPLFFWKSLLLSVLQPPAEGEPRCLLKSKSTPGCGGGAAPPTLP